MLEIATQKNNLSGNGYCFRSNNPVTLTETEFVKEMTNYNSTLTEIDAVAAMHMIGMLFERHVAKGDRVELPFGTFRIVANGTCENSTDVFRSGIGDNKIGVVFEIKSEVLKDIRRDARFKMISNEPASNPIITEIAIMADDGSPSESNEIKAGRPLKIRGRHLDFDIKDVKQGVYLEGSEDTYKVSVFYHRGGECIDFIVPESTPAGEYKIKVSAKPRKDCYISAESSTTIIVK